MDTTLTWSDRATGIRHEAHFPTPAQGRLAAHVRAGEGHATVLLADHARPPALYHRFPDGVVRTLEMEL